MQRASYFFILLSLVCSVGLSTSQSECGLAAGHIVHVATPAKISDERSQEIRHWLEKGALRYFTDNTHPQTGMTLDRASKDGEKNPANRIASLAATGFSMTVMSDAAKRGAMDSKLAEKNILHGLRFASKLENHEGWLPHFVDWETGKNINQSEFSTIDTAIFVAGALYAAQSFPQNAEMQRLAQSLYEQLDFRAVMTNGGKDPGKRTLSMGWSPKEKSYIPANWDTYSEHIILQILGLGHPTESKRLPADAWKAWTRQSTSLPEGGQLVGADLPLFTHQYPWLWLDPHQFKEGGFDPFENSKTATLRDKKLSAAHPLLAPYGIWGLSASDGPSPDHYRAYRHGDGKEDPGDVNGTVCPGCVAGSLVYAPNDVLPYLDGLLKSPFRDDVTGKYGFVDAFNPSKNWVGADSLGITVGPAYLSSRNLDGGAIWQVFQKIPAIQKGIQASQGKIP